MRTRSEHLKKYVAIVWPNPFEKRPKRFISFIFENTVISF